MFANAYNRVQVVEDVSSYLNLPAIEVTEHIGRSHQDMCRFTGPDDVEYKKVTAALSRMTHPVSKQSKGTGVSFLSDEQKSSLMESLRFDQIDARQMTIRKAHSKTCKWLLSKSEYLEWLDARKLDDHHGFLWIKGKPGAGKSTLMKFCLVNARKNMKDSYVISFFFNARGSELEKSTLGTYRTLLLQLLDRFPAPESLVDSVQTSTWVKGPTHQWNIEHVKSLLEEVILSLGNSSVMCLIDALDECDERQIRDMTSFFERVGELALSAGIRFQTCFSSRHYPHITLPRSINLVLEGQEGHSQDISNYLESELKIGQSEIAKQIRIEVKEKASGVFLWVILVVEILNKEYDSGRIHKLRRRLQDIPGDLHELFSDILTRDSHHRHELVSCVQWILFARQPLTPAEIYIAIVFGVDPQEFFACYPDDISLDDIRRYLINASKGLAEVTTSIHPRVQFIHESVKDFFLKENGLSQILPDFENGFQGQSHEQLKKCCMMYVYFVFDHPDYLDTGKINGTTHPPVSSKGLPKASSEKGKALREGYIRDFPFLGYAVRQVLYHADCAENYSISQSDFIHDFPLHCWIWLNNLIEKHQVRRYGEKASLLYILAEKDLSSLIAIHPSVLSFHEVENERYGCPLLAALATGSGSAVEAFVAAFAASRDQDSELQDLCKQYRFDRSSSKTKIGRDFQFTRSMDLLSTLFETGHETLIAIVLACERPDASIKDSVKENHLWQAIENDHRIVVKLLLENEAYKEQVRGTLKGGPLRQAVELGHEAIVQILLHYLSRTDLEYSVRREILLEAAGHGYQTTVKTLLDDKAKLHLMNCSGGHALSAAAAYGYESIVEILLENGADVNSSKVYKDYKGWLSFQEQTPLLLAASSGHATVVELLLATGKADVNSKDPTGSTPLSCAATMGHELVIKLLLRMDEIVVDSKNIAGWTPLSKAAFCGHAVVVELLLATNQVNVESRNNHGATPLWLAAWMGRMAVVALLVERGNAKITVMDEDGVTPRAIAARKGRTAVAEYLREKEQAVGFLEAPYHTN